MDRRYDGLLRAVRRPEDASFRRARRAQSPERVLAVLFLVRHAGLSQRAAAERLGMGSGSAACRQLAAAGRWLEGDSALRSAVAKAERQLAAASAEEGHLAEKHQSRADTVPHL